MTEYANFGQESRLFTGTYIDIMPDLIEQKLTPVNPAMVMDRRIEAAKSKDERLIEALWDNYWDTNFGAAAAKDLTLTAWQEKIYLHPNSRFLLSSFPDANLITGGVPLNTADIDSSFFISERGEHILGRQLTEKQARNHKLWLALADNSQERLNNYVEQAFRLGRNRHGYKEMMGIYVPYDSQLILRDFYLSRLSNWSIANSCRDLADDYAFLVGVRAEKILQ